MFQSLEGFNSPSPSLGYCTTTSFSQSFDAAYDLRLYQQAKGYREEGDYYVWEPQDESETEPEVINYGPGAARRGELDTYDCEEFYSHNDEPGLGYEELEEF